MKTIKLLGKLGQRFGREFQMEVRSPAEAIRSLCYQIPGFQQFLYHSSDVHGIEYRVVVEDAIGRSEAELYYPVGSCDVIVIAPIASGSGGGFGRILLGAVLIGAAFAFPVGILGISSTTIGLLGASLVVGGVATMLSPQQKTPKDREKQDSYLFDRASEVGRQGSPVPALIGERIIQLDVVLSSSLVTNDIPV